MPGKSIRLFFGLWPDQMLRKQLIELARQVPLLKNARLTRQFNLHLTLHFIGNTTTDRLPCYIQQAQSVEFEPFSLSLDELGNFKKQKIVWAGCNHIPGQLEKLHQDLGEALKHCGYLPEKRRYKPHVTLYRKAMLAQPCRIPTIKWTVKSFSLIKSEADKNGVVYSEIKRFNV